MAWNLADLARATRARLFPPDPGRFRLLGAVRATLGGVLALALSVAATTMLPMPFTARVLAFSVALFLGALVRDPTRGGQAVTMAVSPVPVLACTVLVALALRVPYLPSLLTIAAVFAGICAASCGPRWAALGGLSLIALLIALLSRVTLAELPVWALATVLGAASALLIRFVILPERPQALRRRLRRSVARAITGVLDRIAAAVEQGGWSSGDRVRLRREVTRLNEATMLLQPRLAPGPALHLLEVDLLCERMARLALLDLGTPETRPHLLARIASLRQAIATESVVAPSEPDRSAGRLDAALGVFELLLARPTSDTPPPPPPPPAPAVASPWAMIEIRPGVQAALATALAILGGRLIAPDRWYFAVFAAFAVFQGTRSRAESVAKALEMLAGSLAGVVGGVLLATLLAGHFALSLAAVIVGLFLAFFASTAAYTVMVFWLTVILGLVYGMLGYFPPELLWVRLQETVVGAVAGALVASLVLVRPAPNPLRSGSAAFLRALAGLIPAAAAPLRGEVAGDDLAAKVLALEQRYQALRAAAATHIPGTRRFAAERTRRVLLLLAALDAWARELVRTTLHLPAPDDPAMTAIARQATAHIAEAIEALTAFFDGTRAPEPRPAAGPDPPLLSAVPPGEAAAFHALRLLLRIEGALLHMRQRLEVA